LAEAIPGLKRCSWLQEYVENIVVVNGHEVERQRIRRLARNFVILRHDRRASASASDIEVKYYRGPWTNTIPLSEEERDELEAFAVGEEESGVYYDAWERAGNRPGEFRAMV
jgi:hypothetical protein